MRHYHAGNALASKSKRNAAPERQYLAPVFEDGREVVTCYGHTAAEAEHRAAVVVAALERTEVTR